MSDPWMLTLRNEQIVAATKELQACNELSQRYGLSLSETDIRSLITARNESLSYEGRVELGAGIMPKLIYAFCDSPFITRDEYVDTLMALQSLFYTFKNESEDSLSDDELIEALHTIFHGRAQGSLEYLEYLTVPMLYKALRKTTQDEEDDDDDWSE